ncbi:putative Ig domain-containing protein [Actinoplanes sp. CA-252034]|uniref:putative Ig domain-containing protein n=1 Tax=Actinoplanes sp. CA-252034 TaxID=3239906 RepID=UPI003D9826AB
MRSEDDGFTLVELLVALAVLSVGMAGMGSFFLNGSLAVSHQRDQRQAVQLASSTIEQVRGLKGSSLLAGRGPAKAKSQWDKALSGDYRGKMKRYLGSMQIASDPEITNTASAAGDTAALSTATQTITAGTMQFQRDIFVGRCEIYYMRNDDCVDPAAGTPPDNAAEILKYFRVVVLVTWTGKSCSGDNCSYIASTLVASETEPTFDSKAGVPDLITTDMWFYVNSQTTNRLDVDHGQQPNVWSWGATKPSWLTIDPKTGLVTGVPTVVGDTSTTVTVTDSLKRSDSGTVVWHAVTPPTISAPTVLTSIAGDPVSLTVTAANGMPKRVFSEVSMDDALTIDRTTGVITGTITTAGTYPITVKVEDAKGKSAEVTFNLTVTAYKPPTITVPPALQVNYNTAVNASAVAANGDAKFKYTATGLPDGVTVNATTGALTGAAKVAGRYLPTITVTDGRGGTAAGSFELVVNSTVVLNFTSPALVGADQTGKVGTAIPNLTLATNGQLLTLSGLSYDVTGLPPGLKWNNGKDAIIGTPTTSGTYQVKVVATGKLLAVTQTAVLTLNWTIT